MDRRLVRGGDPAHRADRHGLAGRAGDAGAGRPCHRRDQKAAAEAGRAIDDDHYGAGIPYRFGSPDDPALAPLFEAYRKRTGRDPKDYFAIGDAEAIVAKIGDYVEAGVSKFILRPSARGDDEIMAQTRRLIEEVLPRVAGRWPKPQKRRVAAECSRYCLGSKPALNQCKYHVMYQISYDIISLMLGEYSSRGVGGDISAL